MTQIPQSDPANNPAAILFSESDAPTPTAIPSLAARFADRPRRSALFMPASNPRALAKARSLPADVIILDLEDAVAPELKDEARKAALATVYAGGFGHREIAIRVNGLDTPWGAEDLAAVADSGVDAILVPKVNGPQDVLTWHEALSTAPAELQLWTMIESCASVLRLDAMGALAASTRLSLWMVGTNDLAREMRARPGPDRAVFQPLLTFAVAAARAHGIAILDAVCNDFRDLDRFRAECEQGLMLGFDGKSLIHPDQIAPCHAVFTPSMEELDAAQRILDAFAAPEAAGKGAIRVDGRMVELLHLEEARRLIALARKIGE
ncbi:HpcH/HpaI aldolase/citrate lyase family protein [Novosphingobium terrae]|uniref:HpcH/HpaI aldolase/citrate lyase family protein n=1 Tax=Novosphingobium terrae TaxID=2726189 RepID=UPI00237B0A84|nr:CoA ester lyase [Novosphingobium terrae]